MEEKMPIKTDVANALTNGTSSSVAKDEETRTTPVTTSRLLKGIDIRKPKRSFFDYFKISLKAYGGSVAASVWVVPIGTSAVTLGLYLSPPLPIFAQPAPNWYPVVFGMIFSYSVCAIVALFLCYFASAEGANTGSYGLLVNRLCQLEARLSVIDSSRRGREAKKLC